MPINKESLEERVSNVFETLQDHFKTDEGGYINLKIVIPGLGEYYIEAADGECRTGKTPNLQDILKSRGVEQTIIELNKLTFESIMMKGASAQSLLRRNQVKFQGSPGQVMNIANRFNIKV